MSIFKPPPPTLIGSGGGGSSGPALINTSSSIVLNEGDGTGNSNITISVNNEPAVVIDQNQNMLIGSLPTSSSTPTQRLVVSSPNGSCLVLLNESTGATTTLQVAPDGTLSINPSGNAINFNNSAMRMNDGAIYLNGIQVTATADEINYLKTIKGIAVPSKALVVDNDKNIIGINALAATFLTGTLQTAYQPNITRVNTLNIANSFSLNGVQVVSSAEQLNYLNVTPGTSIQSKALILDASRSIAGINSLGAINLAGTLLTGVQPNITQIGSLSKLNVTGWIGVGTVNPSSEIEIYSTTNPSFTLNNGLNSSNLTIDLNGNLLVNSYGNVLIKANKSLQLTGTTGDIVGVRRVYSSYLTGLIESPSQPNITTIGNLTTLNVSTSLGIGTTAPTKKVEIVDTNGSFLRLTKSVNYYTEFDISSSGDLLLNVNNGNILLSTGTSIRLTSANITGVYSLLATNLTGTIQTAYQPFITTIGTLSTLTVTNNITCGSLNTSTLTGTLQTSAQPFITSIGTLTTLTVTESISTANVIATTLTGTLQTASQLNITRVGTLLTLTVNGDTTTNNLIANNLTGTLLTVEQPNITKVGTLNNLNVNGSVTTQTVNATTLIGTLQTVAQPNITSIGTLSTLSVTGIINANSVIAPSLTGTLQTASQPNITQVGTLQELTVTNTITTNKVIASELTGEIQTEDQPYITSVGTLSSVITSGYIGIKNDNPEYEIDINTEYGDVLRVEHSGFETTLTTNVGNLIVTTEEKYLILNNSTKLQFTGTGTIVGLNTLTATNLVGTLQTAAQPLITSIGTLTTLETNSIGIGSVHSDIYKLIINNSTGKLVALTDGTTSANISIVNNDLTLASSNKRIALGTDVDLVFNGGHIIGLDLGGSTTITTAAQPNITSLGTLTALNVNGPVSLLGANNTLTTAGGAHIGGNLVVDGNISFNGQLNLNNLSLSTLTVNTNLPALTSTNGGTLTIIGGTSISRNLIVGESLEVGSTLKINGITIDSTKLEALSNVAYGTITANKIIGTNSSNNINGLNCISATTLKGTIQTPYQPYITTVGNLENLNVNNFLGVGTASPIKALEVNSTNGACLRLSYDKTTSSTNYVDMSVSATGNLSITPTGGLVNIDQLISTKLAIGNTTNNVMPLELGFTPFVMTAAYGYNTNLNAHGTIAAGGTASYNYSIRALGRILCTQSLDVTSDRRVKKNIKELDEMYCTRFVNETTPVSFNLIDGDSGTSYGYIAQDLLRHGFSELVTPNKDEQMVEEIDEDGLISPHGIKFTIAYEHIIPILAKNQKKIMEENMQLKQSIDILMKLVQDLKNKIDA